MVSHLLRDEALLPDVHTLEERMVNHARKHQKSSEVWSYRLVVRSSRFTTHLPVVGTSYGLGFLLSLGSNVYCRSIPRMVVNKSDAQASEACGV